MITHYEIKGEGDVVVLLHGLFGNLSNLRLLSNSLSQHCKVVSVDLANHGQSKHCGSVSHRSMALDLKALLSSLGFEKVSLVGHSLGGKVAMQFALTHPERVNKLVVADIAPVAYPNLHDAVFTALDAIDLTRIRWKQEVSAVLIEQGIDAKVASFLQQSLLGEEGSYRWSFDLNGLKHSYPELMGWKPGFDPYAGPALFVKGGMSDYVCADREASIYSLFPQASIKEIKGAGHWLHVEKVKQFNGLVGEFLK